MHVQFFAYIFGVIIAGKLVHILTQTLISPLRSVPGPLLARFTNLWYFFRVRAGRFESENIDLHRKYGPIVRLGPNLYSIDSPEVVKTVYSIGSKFIKHNWYEGWKHPSPERWSLFTLQDPKKHNEERRKVQALYSLSSLVNYEPYVNECMDIFGHRLNEIASSGRTINMSHWLQYYAFDVIAYITYSKRFGFLDQGDDVGGLIGLLEDLMKYSTLIGIYAWLHPILWPLTTRIRGTGAEARAAMIQRIQTWTTEKMSTRKDLEKSIDVESSGPQDFMDKLLIANRKEPGKVTGYNIMATGTQNIMAGSDTTAASISGILYHLLNNSNILKKLRDEIDEYDARGELSKPTISFKESQRLPYLQAVLKEGMRMHAAVGLPLWRVVPEGGAEICGQYFPAGTIVGLNAWVAHYNDVVFENAHLFRPERWLEADAEKLKRMDAYYMPFGLGSRTCIGKHISVLEMDKLISNMIRSYDLELDQAESGWETVNYWFVKPNNFPVRVKARTDQSS